MLSKTDQYLAFYAFPYIKNPREHKAFKHIFNKRWLKTNRENIEEFLTRVFKVEAEPS